MEMVDKKLGDFSGLAGNYARFRQGYSESILTAILALVDKPAADIDAADLGAGTGIWTREMAARGFRHVWAVEPNEDMRVTGSKAQAPATVEWVAAGGESTGLPSESCDLVTAASSFHWMDYDRTTAEIKRVLRPGGRFVALWNPRQIEINPLLVEIESELRKLNPAMKRISSGRSAFTDTLTERLAATPELSDVVYLEGRHAARQTPDDYLGAWKSVNDVQAQLGPERWALFLAFVTTRTASVDAIETVFLTRAWTARYDPK